MTPTNTTCSAADQTSFPLKILAVGDGDLTLSLALSRAYQSQLDLVATTLEPTFDDLCRKYSNSKAVVEELHKRGCSVEYGVDATNLTSYPSIVTKQGFDLILFHHPHLGLGSLLGDEQYHAHRHYVLLAHFLASAKDLLCTDTRSKEGTFYDGRIGLCLAHDQPQTWKLAEAAQRQGLTLVKETDTASPFHDLVSEFSLSQSWISPMEPGQQTPQQHTLLPLEPAPAEPHFKAPRRYRNGKLGSYHFLGKYGYCHRRTHGDIHTGREGDMNVQGSRHFFFAIDKGTMQRSEARLDDKCESSYQCNICGSTYPSESALRDHLNSPAIPDPPTEELTNANSQLDQKGNSASKKADPLKHHSMPTPYLTESERAKISEKFESNWEVVPEKHGKRLRRFLQHVAMPKLSRKQNDILVSQGQIYVNGSVALDTSRILNNGDIVSMRASMVERSAIVRNVQAENRPQIAIVASYPAVDSGTDSDSNLARGLPKDYLLVADKPVGMRNRGNSGCTGTLEEAVSLQRKKPYKSISAIDTGCNGLSVLQLQKVQLSLFADLSLEQEFTALVHGRVPLEWDAGIRAAVPWKNVRQWRRKAEKISITGGVKLGDSGDCESNGCPQQSQLGYESDDDDEEEYGEKEGEYHEGIDDNLNEADCDVSNECPTMTIRCVERTNPRNETGDNQPDVPELCTLKISTSCLVSGLCRAICLYLRKRRYPVVGDRKCHREFVTLPRSIRNRIKKKLCLGCYKVNIDASITYQPNEDAGGPKNDQSERNTTFEHHWISTVEVPFKLRALYWQEHCDNATVAPKNKNAAPSK